MRVRVCRFMLFCWIHGERHTGSYRWQEKHFWRSLKHTQSLKWFQSHIQTKIKWENWTDRERNVLSYTTLYNCRWKYLHIRTLSHTLLCNFLVILHTLATQRVGRGYTTKWKNCQWSSVTFYKSAIKVNRKKYENKEMKWKHAIIDFVNTKWFSLQKI